MMKRRFTLENEAWFWITAVVVGIATFVIVYFVVSQIAR